MAKVRMKGFWFIMHVVPLMILSIFYIQMML